ncbi:NAD(P)H-hydrate dehydratase [Aestuariispira insulae]|uniref:Bifunctional NAD(P)H-hydrate repair enzyme n=1 Tax=Aestuariispira insulae TaxID=1461337 RepID=A0A3D9HV17_9PROT|nr:NAD(P)H-hydrate dehydratase [Aestuariispira insulae]RED53338.1 NAD(P)H-hydrate epimerase [Aestuariispira insulae]
MTSNARGWPDYTTDLNILTVAQCYQADQEAMARGITGETLMEAAGAAIAREILARWPSGKAAILCGPGNNGGDGFVVARLLKEAGWQVVVGLLGEWSQLRGDASTMAQRWGEDVRPLTVEILDGATLVVDALFGAGLSKPVEGIAAETLEAIGQVPVVAVDVPSGLHGDSTEILGTARPADLTVTFFRPKRAHRTYPGALHCGEVVVADIGIPAEVLDQIAPTLWENDLELWRDRLPRPGWRDNKFSRGMLAMAAGVEMTGAARLAARAAQRAGAGYVLLASPEKASTLYRVSLESVVVKGYRDTLGYSEIISDERVNACLIGPGLGTDFGGMEKVLATLRREVPTVLDADALSLFEGNSELLFENLHGGCVLTPHAGEFKRLFPEFGGEDYLALALAAAKKTGAVILLKGANTFIASPEGEIIVNTGASADLATAGTGDVLAGLIAGILAQTGEPLLSASIGAWMHSRAGKLAGPGLIAEDLSPLIPKILNEINR